MKIKGFTLIELLVVITVIGVLSVIITSNLSSARSQATDKRLQKLMHNLQVKLELHHLEHGEYPGGQFASYYDPSGASTSSVSLDALAGVLGVDADQLYPCSQYDANCKSSFQYYSPRNGFGNANCWKNHYLIFYTIENPTTPLQPREDYPCGTNGAFGDDPVPEFCTDQIHQEWEDFFCDYYTEQEKQYTLIIK